MVIKGTSKLLLTLAIAAILALGLTACGGGDDSTGSTAASTPSGEGGAGSGSGGGSGSGEGAASFRVSGGDNSIQDYGEEADAEELADADAALSSYLEARAAGDWEKSCTYLAASALEPIEKLGEATPQLQGLECGDLLEKLQSAAPASSRVSTMTGGLGALRVQGQRAFALYHGAKGADYFVLMTREGDEWKVGALVPTEFP